jgi:hypothetical protein
VADPSPHPLRGGCPAHPCDLVDRRCRRYLPWRAAALEVCIPCQVLEFDHTSRSALRSSHPCVAVNAQR